MALIQRQSVNNSMLRPISEHDGPSLGSFTILCLATGPGSLFKRARKIRSFAIGPVDTDPVIRCAAAEGDGLNGARGHSIASIGSWCSVVNALFESLEASVQLLNRLCLQGGVAVGAIRWCLARAEKPQGEQCQGS